MKRIICALFLLCAFLFTASGCDELLGQGSGQSAGASFNRLVAVTVVDDGETESYSVSWTDNGCSFSNDEGIFDFKFDKSKRTLTLKGNNIDLPIFDYNDKEEIILVYNEDDPDETFEVVYDQNGCPSVDGRSWGEYDPATKKLTVQKGGGGESDEQGNTVKYVYSDVRTYGDKDMILSVDRVTTTTYSDGTVQEKVKNDIEKYTYDENGNMIKYERNNKQILFTYSDEKISHQWERVVPVSYIDFFAIFDLPLFWNLD